MAKQKQQLTKIVAITHTKLRNVFGLVGIELDAEKRLVYVRFAKQWSRQSINTMTTDISNIYKKIRWDSTLITQETGHHLIQALKQEHNIPLKVITTQKKIKETRDIERIRVMDIIEMTQLLLQLKLNHQIRFTENPKGDLYELENQIAIFSEHTTEAGSVDYYAPGEALDSLTKSLMIACFSVRNELTGADGSVICGGLNNWTNNHTTGEDIEMEIEKQITDAFPHSQGF